QRQRRSRTRRGGLTQCARREEREERHTRRVQRGGEQGALVDLAHGSASSYALPFLISENFLRKFSRSSGPQLAHASGKKRGFCRRGRALRLTLARFFR